MSEEVRGFVYLIGSPGVSSIKIGFSRHPQKRLSQIQCMSPVPLQLLWTHPAWPEMEAYLHQTFAGSRSHGEWFTFDSDPVAQVAQAVAAREASRPAGGRQNPALLAAVVEARNDHLQARAELEDAIREARQEGLSLADISEHSGFSREWVRKIIDGKSYRAD